MVAPSGMISIPFLLNRHVVSKATAGDKYIKGLMHCSP